MQISRAVHAAEGLEVLAASSPGRPNTHCKMRSASAKPSCLKQILASPGGLGKSVLVVAPYFNRSFAAVFSLPRQSAKLLCTESTSSRLSALLSREHLRVLASDPINRSQQRMLQLHLFPSTDPNTWERGREIHEQLIDSYGSEGTICTLYC